MNCSQTHPKRNYGTRFSNMIALYRLKKQNETQGRKSERDRSTGKAIMQRMDDTMCWGTGRILITITTLLVGVCIGINIFGNYFKISTTVKHIPIL